MSSGLVLTLKPKERFLVGGNLVENGPRRSSIRVAEGVFVLRLSDALHPEDIGTPVKRAYHAAQRILGCEIPEAEGRPVLLDRLAELSPIFARTPGAKDMAAAEAAAAKGRYHAVLRALGRLIPLEAMLLFATPDAHSDTASCIATVQR